ncbi:MAG: ATP-binding cassette domain-containing protein, partial [Rhodothermales bacterium]
MSTAAVQEPVIELRNVGVAYSSHLTMFRRRRYWGVKDLTLDVYQGETLGVVGRNGAGKSTLLKLLANILAPDAGTMVHRTKKVSLLSLQVGFNQHLSGRENAILSGILLGMTRRDVERQMDEIFAFAELENFIDAPVHSYSSGMKARLGFGVAFQADPDVLLV